MSKSAIAEEFVRRAVAFHPDENPMDITCWGLFRWGDVSRLIKTGEITPNPGFTKHNHVMWCKPSQAFYDKWIAPRIEKMKKRIQ